MKKVINWKVYNTETAEYIWWCSNWLSCSDFKHWEEKLFKTKKWQHFIYWSWWPLSKYSLKEWNTTSWIDDIKLVDKDEILNWLEYNSEYFWKDSINKIIEKLWDNIEEG